MTESSTVPEAGDARGDAGTTVVTATATDVGAAVRMLDLASLLLEDQLHDTSADTGELAGAVGRLRQRAALLVGVASATSDPRHQLLALALQLAELAERVAELKELDGGAAPLAAARIAEVAAQVAAESTQTRPGHGVDELPARRIRQIVAITAVRSRIARLC